MGVKVVYTVIGVFGNLLGKTPELAVLVKYSVNGKFFSVKDVNKCQSITGNVAFYFKILNDTRNINS